MKKVFLLILGLVSLAINAQAEVYEADASTIESVTGSNYRYPVVIDFYATWCGPCQYYSPIVAETADKYSEKVIFLKVDIDNNPDLCDQFNIQCVPTTIIIYNRKNKHLRYEGTMEASELSDAINEALNKQSANQNNPINSVFNRR